MVLSARQLIAGVAAGDTEAVRDLVARLMALEETAQRVEQLEARAELGIHRATVVEGVDVTDGCAPELRPTQTSGGGTSGDQKVASAMEAGDTLADIKAKGLVAGLKDAGVLPREAKEVGYTASEMRKGGYSCAEVRECGFSNLEEAKEAGYSLHEICTAGYTCAEAKTAGYLRQIKAAGFVEGLKVVGYTIQEVKAAGYTTADAKAARLPQERHVRHQGRVQSIHQRFWA